MTTTRIPSAYRFRAAFLALAALCLLVACASARPPAGARTFRAEGAGEAARLLILPAPDGGQERFRLSGGGFGKAVVEGFVRPEGEALVLVPASLDWFNNWTNGWTRARFVLDGELVLAAAAEGWRLTVRKAPEIDTPEQARIRWFDQYFDGDIALERFGRRWDRIAAAAAWLRQRLNGEAFEYTFPRYNARKSAWEPNFRDAVKQRLFPEVFGYPSETEAPPAPDGLDLSGLGRRYAEGIWWDEAWSMRLPAELRELRSSGTLLRDFEECIPLWHLAYAWPGLWGDGPAGLRFEAVGKR